MMRCLAVCLCVLGLFSAEIRAAGAGGTQQHPEDARGWLARMASSASDLNYRGSFLYERGGVLETLSISHAKVDGIERERLTYLSGVPREVLRVGEAVVCTETGEGGKAVRRGWPGAAAPGFTSRFSSLPEHYDVSLQGQDRVAGRVVRQLALIPRDAHRYGYQLSVDESTGLLLRSVLMSDAGRPLERFLFVTLDVGTTPEANEFSLEGQLPGEEPVMPATGGEPRWRPGWLPPGFALVSHRAPAFAEARQVDAHVYSDGLAVFSLFVEPVGAEPADVRGVQGATVAFSRRLRSPEGQEFLVTLVGEIPPATAEVILSRIEPGATPP